MKTLQRVIQRRRMMLMGMARQDMLKGDFQRMLSSLGYDGSKRTLDPSRFRPPTDNTQDFMQKWVQVALNVLLGTKLKIDGKIGPITRQAIKRLQRQEGLTAHGYMDDRTLQVMEMRVGVKAPRHVEHEAIPHLLMLPRRGVWKPGKKDGKGRRKGGGRSDKDKKEEPDADVGPAKAGILQEEAMSAVAAVAFDEDFVSTSAERLGRKDKKALGAHMKTWLKEAESSEDTPDWLQRARDLARAHQELSASILRQNWWSNAAEDA